MRAPALWAQQLSKEYIHAGERLLAVKVPAATLTATLTPNRSGVEFAKALLGVARACPDAETIHLVMDNLDAQPQVADVTDLYGQ